MNEHTYVPDSVVVAARCIEHHHIKHSHRHRPLSVRGRSAGYPANSLPYRRRRALVVVATSRGGGGPTTNQRDQNVPKKSVEHVALELELSMRVHARTDWQSSIACLSSSQDCGENAGIGVVCGRGYEL